MLQRLSSSLIKFKSKIADTIERLLSDKLSDTVNIKDFGAKCDGVTDDTDAVQAAFAHKKGVGLTRVMFPAGADVVIKGTVYIPTGVSCDFNGSILRGADTNTMFETAVWENGRLVTNWGKPAGSALITDSHLINGFFRNCNQVFKLFNFITNCKLADHRAIKVNQFLHARECFYGSFERIMTWDPLSKNTLPCYVWEGDIQAQGVRKVFASGYGIGHHIQGFNDVECFDTCSAESCTTGVYLTGGRGEQGGIQNLEFHNWYFEGNNTAVKADPNFVYQRINFKNCFWSLNIVNIDSSTILSGSFDESNVFLTTSEKPGNFNMTGVRNGERGFRIGLPAEYSNENFWASTINPNQMYTGSNVIVERKLTYAHPTDGSPIARTSERKGIHERDCIGSSVGFIPTNKVPFCEVTLGDTNAVVLTRIPVRPHEMLSFSLTVVDGGGSWDCTGFVINGKVHQGANQKAVSISTGRNGCYQLTVSGGLSNVTSCTGSVRLV